MAADSPTPEDRDGGYVHDEHLVELDAADRRAPTRGVRGFINNHKVGTAVGGTVIVAGVVTAVLVSSAVRGPMAVDQDAVDMFNAKVDEKSVSFYDSVCAEVNVLAELPRKFATADADSIGLDLPGRAGVYTASADDVVGDVSRVRERVAKIDENAPVVERVDGAAEGTDYHGALEPLMAYLDTARGSVADAAGSPDLREPDDDEALTRAVTSVRDAVTAVPGGVAEPLQESLESASLFSEATQKAVTESMNCRSLLNPDAAVDPDYVVEAYPDLLEAINEASTAWAEGLEPLQAFSDGAEQSYDDAVAALQQAWLSAAAGAEKSIAVLDRFTVHEDDEKAQQAAAGLPGERDRVRDGYDSLRQWALDASDRIAAVAVADPTQADVDALDAEVSALSDEFTERNVAQQKLVTRVGTSLAMPNDATAEAARERVPGGDKSTTE